MSSGYDDDYDSEDERRRHKNKHRRHSRPGSRPSNYDSGTEGKEKKKKGGLSEKEKGFGASLLGGAGGAFVGHEVGGGALGTILGIGAGAIGAAFLEKDHEKQKKKEREKEKERQLKYRDDFEYGSSHVGSVGSHSRSEESAPVDYENDDYRRRGHSRERRRRSRSRGRRGTPEQDSSSESEYERRRK